MGSGESETSLTMGTMVTIPKWNVFHDGLTQPGNDKNTLRTGIDGPVEMSWIYRTS